MQIAGASRSLTVVAEHWKRQFDDDGLHPAERKRLVNRPNLAVGNG